MESYDTINYIKINPLAGRVNNSYADFAPVKSTVESIVFSSIRSDSVITIAAEVSEFRPVKLYTSTKEGQEWSEPVEMKEWNHPYDQTANGIFSPDKKTFYFTRCRPNKKGEQICSIYTTKLTEGKWSKPEKLGNGINQKKYTSTQPSLGSYLKVSGKKKAEYPVLYFVSNRPGGKGKNDLWFSQWNDKGKFTKPANCGPKINTIGNEATPYFDNLSNTLYFSSDFHPGAGGFDVFKSEGNLAKWGKVENMTAAVNSSYDDLYFNPGTMEESGFIVSNRPGSIALKGETCCEDIYEVRVSKQIMTQITGITRPENKQKGEILKDVMISVFPTGKIKSHIKKYGTLKNLKDSLTWINKSDTSGIFSLETSKSKNYSIIFAKDSFDIVWTGIDSALAATTLDIYLPDLKDSLLASFINKNQVKTPIENTETPVIESVKSFTAIEESNVAEGDIFLLEKVSFDSDKDDINKQTRQALEGLYKYLEQNPKVKVEVSGHTDNTGSEQHNLELSQRRAEKIKTYLVEKGISKKRIKAIGYGESQPLAPNENPDGSDNPENRKMNRRTEIKILEGGE
jgi:OmpA-OmpF porin, OOP family